MRPGFRRHGARKRRQPRERVAGVRMRLARSCAGESAEPSPPGSRGRWGPGGRGPHRRAQGGGVGRRPSPSKRVAQGVQGRSPGTFQTEFGITCYTKGCSLFWLEEKMAHVAKYNASALGRMCGHYERSAEKHGYVRENIDNGQIGANYNLAPSRQGGQVAFINGRIEGLGLKRRPRENAVRMCDCVVTAPPEVPDGELRKFFEAESAALSEIFGTENLVSAWVHLDEPGARPHMHWAWVPVTDDGRLSAKEVVSRTVLRELHPALQKAADKALGHHVQVVLDDGKKAAEYVGMDEYKAATAEARKAAEKASEARKAAETAERAQKAAESRKRDSEAAAEASEKARKQAASDAEAAKKDLETQRRRAKQLGPDGGGINWGHKAADGSWITERHEKSLGEVRAERDAAQKRLDLQKRESAALDSWKKSAFASLSDAQDKASRAEARAAKAEADRKAAEAAKTQAEASLSKIQASVRQGQEAARALSSAQAGLQKVLAETEKARQERDRYARERLIDWTAIDSAIAEAARYVATVVVSLWDSARDFAVSVWQSWRGNWGLSITSRLGYSKQDHENVCDEQMAEVCVEQRRPDIAHALGVGDEREERGYDDWER